jgi:hypothetical protein
MSLNWVMVKDGAPVELPGEVFVYRGSRISVHLQVQSTERNEIKCGSGKIYLSAQRVVYLPDDPVTYRVHGRGDKEMKSMGIPISDINSETGRIVSPWFGPYQYHFRFMPTPDAGFEPHNAPWSASLQFKEGGIVEFDQKFNDLFTLPKYAE